MRTPDSAASAGRSGSCLRCISRPGRARPIPPRSSRDSRRRCSPPGSIEPNIRSTADLPGDWVPDFFSAAAPQNVKNMETAGRRAGGDRERRERPVEFATEDQQRDTFA